MLSHVLVLICFSSWIIFHCMDTQHFAYTFFSWCTICFHLLAIMNTAAMNSLVQVLSEYTFSFLLGTYIGLKLLEHIILCLNMWGKPNYFPKWLHHFTSPLAVYEESKFSTSSPTFVIFCFDYGHSSRYLIVVLNCISLMAKDTEFPSNIFLLQTQLSYNILL